MPHKNYRRSNTESSRYRTSRSQEARSPEYEHLLQHVFFLEERVTDLELKVEQIRDVFGFLLGIDEEDSREGIQLFPDLNNLSFPDDP